MKPVSRLALCSDTGVNVTGELLASVTNVFRHL